MKKILTLLVLSCWYFNSVGATLTVCPSGCGYTTIAAALSAASNGDIIHVNVTGYHTEYGILINKSVTIKGNGKAQTYIQGAATRLTAADRVFNIPRTQAGTTLDDALTVSFEDLTIQNGYASFQSAGQFSFGGGIQINNGNGSVYSFTNVDFKTNDTRTSCPAACSNGGGAGMYISCTSGNATLGDNTVIINLSNCVFDDNNTGTATANSSGSGQQGGAMQMNARGTIIAKNCSFTNNTAFTSGGVMYNGSAIVGSFTNCKFEGNNVTEPAASGFQGSSFSGTGGGFGIRSSVFAFTNCSFKNNSSPSMGGAVWGGSGHAFTNCTFYGNSSQYGGAIYRMNGIAGSTMSVINCTFSGNTASVAGRAIIVGNHAPTTTSIYNIALINTIINTNLGAAASDIHFYTDYSRLTVNQKNYVNSFSGVGTAPTFDYNSVNATLGLAATPANNGGSIETMALDNTSTLVDVGTNNVSGYSIPVKDARNYSRTDAGVDLGAYEKAGIIDDATAPAITYTVLANTPLTTDRALTATITDANGVYPWTSLVPRIYFKKGTGGSWQSTAGTLSTGIGRNGTWSFTITNASMGGVTSGDVIYYYVIAQDVSTAKNITSNPSGVSAIDVNTVSTPPATPNSYTIGSACNAPTVPTLSATSSSICSGASTTLSIATGTLNDATSWKWYSGSCGGTAVGTGTSVSVSPTSNTTYYARGEGGCVTPGSCGSVAITVTAAVTPSVSIASSDTDNKICAGTSVTFTPTPTNGGASPAYQWKLNGTNVSTAATYTTTALANGDEVTVELTSNATCASPATATSNTIATTVDATVTPSVTIASSDADNKICAGTSVTFTPTPTNGGASPAYQWKLNGNNVSTAATYTTTTLANNDAVTVVLTSNALCASPATATSSGITTTVDATVTPSVTIASSDADNKICAGTSVTFTPTPTNGGASPAYQWKLNGNNVSTAATYTTTGLANNDAVAVVLTSDALCASPATATSTGITTTVDAVVTPSVTIASSDADNKICAGASVTFTPTPVNGGSSPTYQWKLNGNNVSTAATYTTTTLANNDAVTVVLTSNALCASTTTATSSGITTTVDALVTPSVTIASSDADNKICAGTSVTFTPTPTNGGASPTYQWKLNGNNVSTAATYTTTTLANNDAVTVVLTSNALCASPATATSIGITTTVDATVTPSVTIASSDADNKICAGTSVTFTPTPTNGGVSPAYQWKLNGNNVSTAATYTTTGLANNDAVTVVLTSDALCASPITATSTGITTTVDAVVTPSVTIASSDADNKICAGASVTFTPTPVNGGSSPTYQWKLNGNNVSTAATYTTTTLANNDAVTVVLTSNALCASTTTATSSGITTTVDALVTPSVTIASSDADNKICAGTSVTFTPTPANGGTTPAYQWKVNGSNVSTAATYTTTSLTNNAIVTVVMTSNALCPSPATATSAGITTTVDAIVIPSVTIASSDGDNKICAGTSVTFTPTPTNGGASPTYQWKVNGSNVSTAATYTTTTLANNDAVTVVLTSDALCASPTTATSTGITTTVDAVVTPSVTIASSDADNKICAGASVTFTPTPVNGGSSPTYQWKLNGNNVSTAATYTTTTLANNDAVTVVLTSNALCASTTTATSSGITTTVDALVTPSVTIASSDADNKICAGTSVTFTPTPTNGGTTPTYQWKVNGSNVSTAATYTTTSLTNNAIVTVVLTSNALCPSPATATSAGITTTVDATVTPSVTIASSDADNKICAGISVTFTPTPINGGSSPAYQWKLNGNNVSTAATYTTTILGNNDAVTVVLTSNALCASPATATSSGITTTVDAVVTPSVTITSSDADNKICAGASVTFTPTPVNGGSSPAYQWKLNGNNVSTAATYTTTTLANNDVVTVVLTSNALCALPTTATATGITTTVDPIQVPSVTIVSDALNNEICAGTSVTFTPTPTNGGSSPTYQWKLNGNNVSTASSYTTTALVNNDEVSVVLTSNALCASPATATSNVIKIKVTTVVVPSVSIVSDDADNIICAGTKVTFTPTPVNGGTTPTYQWKLNGNNVTTTTTYTTDSLKNNDVVNVIMTSSSGCASPTTATSGSITTKVNQLSTADITKIACDSVKFDTKTYTTSGTYTVHLVNAAGCDSTVTLHVTINKSSKNTITETGCDSIRFDNTTYISTGVYTVVLKNKAGCDSTVTLNLTIHKSTTATITETACDSLHFDTKTYTSTGIYIIKLKNKAGCDSVVTLNLTIHKSTVVSVTKVACDSLIFNNQTYKNSGIYTIKIKNAANCDSTITLNATINKTTTSIITETACDSLRFDNKTYTISGTYTAILKNKTGCDSVVTLHLTINKSTKSTVSETACDSLHFANQTYTVSGVYTVVTKNKAGCDSIITLNATIHKSSNSVQTQTACDSLIFNGQKYTVSGVYTVKLKNVAGCDSIVTLNLTINNSNAYTLVKTACGSFTLNSQTYTTSGTYMQLVKNVKGCDSVITLQLTIKPGTNNGTTITPVACDKFEINGQTYTSSGMYKQTLTNAAGCDSVLTIQLTILHSTAYTLVKTACNSFTLNGQTYMDSGVFTQKLKNSVGCDSILTIQLTIEHLTATATVSNNTLTANTTGAVYQWINCNGNTVIPGATSQSFTPTTSGSYAVIISASTCTDTSICYPIVISAIEDVAKNQYGLTVYPNPNNGTFTIQSETEGSFFIVNELGQVVRTFTLNAANSYSIGISELESGMYMIQGVNTYSVIRYKLVVTGIN